MCRMWQRRREEREWEVGGGGCLEGSLRNSRQGGDGGRLEGGGGFHGVM